MKEEVKKCPKCGEPDYHAIPSSWYGGKDGVGSHVTCRKCGTRYETWHHVEHQPRGILVILPRC
jgi:transcriptional regulator NrdR family protein